MEQNNFVSVGDKMLYQRGQNPNLRGMKTQFGNDFSISNQIINNGNDVLNKYDVIPNQGLSYKLVNKPHKLVLRFLSGTTGSSPINIILNENFKDVVSVKLLNGLLSRDTTAASTTLTNDTSVNFVTISIDELNNVYSSSTPAGNELLNSFSTLEYDKTITRDDKPNDNAAAELNRQDIYKTNYGHSQDVTYFDPPLNSLSQLNVRVFRNHSGEITNTSGDFGCKLEFLIETKEKMRLY